MNPQWVEGRAHEASVIAAGSTGPKMTLRELKAISSDPEATAAALEFDDIALSSSSDRQMAEVIADLYDKAKSSVTADDVLVANGATGANTIVFEALLSPGDHIICTFPAYAGLVDVPRALGADISYLHLSEKNNWDIDVPSLKSLIKPSTKMIVLNNPHNPTGATLSTEKQAEILKMASEQNITVLCDEIFRPLFHTDNTPTSFQEHSGYDKVITTGSLSKAWGFPGVRIGWIVCRNAKLRHSMSVVQNWILQDNSVIDKIIGAEVLSERCRPNILAKNLGYAKENLQLLKRFLEANKDTVSCVIPTGAATAFPKIMRDGQAVDDGEFCNTILKEQGLLVPPATQCFGPDPDGELKGRFRFHITIPPENFKKAIGALEAFITSEKFKGMKI
jgi:aspartate/methionine/tyrosine aminotransferase